MTFWMPTGSIASKIWIFQGIHINESKYLTGIFFILFRIKFSFIYRWIKYIKQFRKIMVISLNKTSHLKQFFHQSSVSLAVSDSASKMYEFNLAGNRVSRIDRRVGPLAVAGICVVRP